MSSKLTMLCVLLQVGNMIELWNQDLETQVTAFTKEANRVKKWDEIIRQTVRSVLIRGLSSFEVVHACVEIDYLVG